MVDDWCRACLNLSGAQKAGTLAHRCAFCPSTVTTRQSFKDQEILDEPRSVVHGAQPLFRNGIPASSGELPRPVPLIQRWCGGRRPADDDATFTGRAYTDGAMRGGRFHYLRRAGWAAVLVDHVGKILFGIYGTCTDIFPTALRAELWAIERILSMALPPLVVCVDNQGVIDGIIAGKDWCCSSRRPAADLWRQIWRRLDDIGLEGLEFVKVKGHATQADVDAGRSTTLDRLGNDHADHFAGMGVDSAEEASPTLALRESHKKALRWYRWLLVLAGSWPDDVQKASEEDVKKRRAEATETRAVKKRRFEFKKLETWVDFPRHPVRPHSLQATGGQLVCTSCQKQSSLHSDSRSLRDLCKGLCLGNVLKRCAASSSTGEGGVRGPGDRGPPRLRGPFRGHQIAV